MNTVIWLNENVFALNLWIKVFPYMQYVQENREFYDLLIEVYFHQKSNKKIYENSRKTLFRVHFTHFLPT